MSIIIGSARIGENGKITGGAKGDQKQTKKPDIIGEVSMQEFYHHSKGWYILRAIDDRHGSRLAHAMQRACDNKKIGYSQSDRYSILSAGTTTKKACNCDCSTLVRQCIREAMEIDSGDFTTATEKNALQRTGYFYRPIEYKEGVPLFNGDILVTATGKGHTAIVVSGANRRM